MFFDSTYPIFCRWFLVVLSTGLFLLTTHENFRSLTGISIILGFVLTTCVGILFHRRFSNTENVLNFISKSCLTLIYTCFLPASVAWTLQSNNGIEWFLCLLAVVFAGDIGAYIFGVNFGHIKIAPQLSPNKSLQGALGGLLFSTVTACLFSFVLPNTPILVFAVCGLLGGFLGQVGDFFESTLKRVAGVKDSGTIMPGHGGILDRLDGVLLAGPLFYLAATYFSL